MEMMQLLSSLASQKRGDGMLSKTEKLLSEKDSGFLQALSQILSSETILSSNFSKDMLNQIGVDLSANSKCSTLNPSLPQDRLNNGKELIFLTEDGERLEAAEIYQFIADLSSNTTSPLIEQNTNLGQAGSPILEGNPLLNQGKSNHQELKGNAFLQNSLKIFKVNKGPNLISEAEGQDTKVQFNGSEKKASPANITETSLIEKSKEIQNLLDAKKERVENALKEPIKAPIILEQNVNLPSIQGKEVKRGKKESVENVLKEPIKASILLEQEENLLTLQDKDVKQPKSDNTTSSFLSKGSNSHFSLTNGQLFEPVIEGEKSKFLQEPIVSPKELPEFIMKQIGERVKFNKLTGSSELNLRLKPAELGKITLQLLAQDGQVSVKILTENVRAREMVEQNLGHLKQNLANQGIKCTSIDVEVGTDTSFNQFMGQNHNPFNNPKNGTQSKLRFSHNRKKEIEIDEYSKAEIIRQDKRMLNGLELFA